MRRALLLLGLLAAALWPADGRAERRVALVVGNATYQHVPKLPNPLNDAGAVAGLLERAGFEVVEARNDLGSLEFKRVVREFANVARDSDIAVVYYAGHGIEIGGTNYLIPVDARLANDLDAEDEAVSLDRIVRILEPARRLRLVVLDACRDNPFLGGMRRSIATRAVSQGLAKVEPASSDTLVAFAAKGGSVAEDGTGANSPFTAALVKHIAVPGLDIRLALGRVRDEVLKVTSSRQEPFVYGSLGGATVALVPAPKPVADAGPAPVVNPAADQRRDYELTERIGTREAWDSFLAVHATGLYADLARAARAKLSASDPSDPPGPDPAAETRAAAPVQTPPAAAPAEGRVAALPPPQAEAADNAGPDTGGLARQLQTELKRVGCDPGGIDGDWGEKSHRALEAFNRHARTRFDAKVASLAAIEAVRGRTGRVCPLACGRGMRVEGDSCVAVREPPTRREPSREPPPKRESAASKERRAAPARAGAAASKPAGRPGFISPLCESFITQGSRRCCTYDSGGAPRIICE